MQEEQAAATRLTARTWWNVVPGRKEGAMLLWERCKRRLGWNDELCMYVSKAKAYREFLMCKLLERDFSDTPTLAPSLLVDQMWQMHVLDSQRYSEDCRTICDGHVIRYYPDEDVDARERAIRIQRTKRLLVSRNGPEILQTRAWDFGDSSPSFRRERTAGGAPIVRLRLRLRAELPNHFNGEIIYFLMKDTQKLAKCFTIYAAKVGMDVSGLQFALNGKGLSGEMTLRSLEFDGEVDFIDVFLALDGSD